MKRLREFVANTERALSSGPDGQFAAGPLGYGGSRLKITMLYASVGALRRGQSSQLCYGVVNAKNVSFDPPILNVWPSLNRCVDVSPLKSTTYTLNADDGAGHSDKAQITIQVK